MSLLLHKLKKIFFLYSFKLLILQKMLDLSLTSKQPQLKQDIDDEISVEDTQAAKEMANNHETPMAPDFTNNFQHDTSNSLYNTSEKSNYFDML